MLLLKRIAEKVFKHKTFTQEAYIYKLNKIINPTILFLPPFFAWAELKDLRLSMYTKGLFLSNIVHKSV